MVGAPVHPLRFRANLYVRGWPAWHEFELLDRTLPSATPGSRSSSESSAARPSTSIPETAARDLNIPQALMRRLGHADCGVYAEVIAGGAIGVGDPIVAEEPQIHPGRARKSHSPA